MSDIIVKNDSQDGSIMTGQKAMDTALIVDCVTVLSKHYPHHAWHVSLSTDKSVVQVRCLNINGKIGMIIHTNRVQEDPDRKCVIHAGGELLERARLVRGKCNEDALSFDVSNSANVLDAKYHNQTDLRVTV